MITTLMNQKRGLNRFSKMLDDGDPWAPNNLLNPGANEKHQLNPGGPNNKKVKTYIHVCLTGVEKQIMENVTN